MTNLFRLFMAAGLCFLALLILLVGLARQDDNLLAPLNFFMFLLLCAVYMLPTVLAFYRECDSVLWIALVNVFLGWTIVGWVAALGWANAGKTRPLPPDGHPPAHPLPGQ